MPRYGFCGLVLSSDKPLDGFVPVENDRLATDVSISFEGEPAGDYRDEHSSSLIYVSPNLDGQGTPLLGVWRSESTLAWRICYSDGPVFLIAGDAQSIEVHLPAGYLLADALTYLIGPILGLVLRLRGVICLHASALVCDGAALLLIGPAGSGKSTLAAAFAKSRYPILCEDIAALTPCGSVIHVQPCYPRVRLWPSSVAGLFGSPDILPRITPTWNKRHLDLTQDGYRFANDAIPLGAAYLLAGDSAYESSFEIEPLSANAATVMALIANTYASHLLPKELRFSELSFLSMVSSRVPLAQIRFKPDFGLLDKLRTSIVDDFRDRHQQAQRSRPMRVART